MLERWISVLIKCRWILVIVWVAMLAGSLWLLPDLKFSFNLGRMLRGDEDRVADVKEFYNTFPPSDGHVMVSASADRVLTINDLRAAEIWANQLRDLPEVKTVISPQLLLDLELEWMWDARS